MKIFAKISHSEYKLLSLSQRTPDSFPFSLKGVLEINVITFGGAHRIKCKLLMCGLPLVFV